MAIRNLSNFDSKSNISKSLKKGGFDVKIGPLFVVWGNLCKFGLDFSAVRFRRVSGTLTTIFKMAEKENIGYIAQVIGPVVDVHFDVTDEEAQLPRIHDALDVERGEGKGLWSLRFSNISVKTL